MQHLVELYKEWSGEEPLNVAPLAGAGSNRVYYRLSSCTGKTVIGVVGTSCEENDAFIYLATHFVSKGLPVPEVYAVSADGMRYLQQDLGSMSLFDAIAKGRKSGGMYDEEEKELLRRTMTLLPALQVRGAEGLDFSHCYPQEEMDVTNVMFDLNYFKYCFLKATGIDFHELRLEKDFLCLARDLMNSSSSTFLYRDFQARNVMLDAEGNPCFIDFQGGRKGPLEYDVASFLWQASAHYSTNLRNELIEVYLDALSEYIEVDRVLFHKRLRLFVLFRTLQVLGAYGFRGYFEKKKHFLESIPSAIENLSALLAGGVCDYPYLHSVLQQLVTLPSLQPKKTATSIPDKDEKKELVVRVFSFSYKKGIPEDISGNGGGYVFDCRSTHNPGRYEPYKKLTGLDEPVIQFLEDDGEILTFLESVYQLADVHVARYLERGFTDLMFSFGCTGGQHRSVYSAQHLAEHLHAKFGVKVCLCHREQGIETVFTKEN